MTEVPSEEPSVDTAGLEEPHLGPFAADIVDSARMRPDHNRPEHIRPAAADSHHSSRRDLAGC